MKNPFKLLEPLPQTDETFKAWIIGFLQAAFLFLILGFPIIPLTNQLKLVIELSFDWWLLMGGILGWCFFVLLTQRYWFSLTYNIALLLYKSGEKDRAKKRALNCENKSSGQALGEAETKEMARA